MGEAEKLAEALYFGRKEPFRTALVTASIPILKRALDDAREEGRKASAREVLFSAHGLMLCVPHLKALKATQEAVEILDDGGSVEKAMEPMRLAFHESQKLSPQDQARGEEIAKEISAKWAKANGDGHA